MNFLFPGRLGLRALIAAALLVLPLSALAQGFSVLVTPPRFEDRVTPGTTWRDVVEISNVSNATTRLMLHTLDWTLDAQGLPQFTDALAPGSCRPWVGIEAEQIDVPANGKRRYRFEVAVPADAPTGECRFALMIEGEPQATRAGMPVPVSGRIGVVVYLAIGDAAPRLSVVGQSAQTIEGRDVPVLQIRNEGNAHGRVEGFIEGRDASGKRFTFAPSSLPILAGETRAITLNPQGDNPSTAAPAITWPLQLKGQLDSAPRPLPIEASVAR